MGRLSVLFHAGAIGLGVLLLIITLYLYLLFEDEQNELKEKIGNLWFETDELHKSFASRSPALLRNISQISLNMLEMIFDSSAMSWRVVAASCLFSSISLYCFLIPYVHAANVNGHAYSSLTPFVRMLFSSIIVSTIYLVVRFRNWKYADTVLSGGAAILAGKMIQTGIASGLSIYISVLCLAVSIAFDLAFLFCMRWLLRRNLGTDSRFVMLLTLLLSAASGIALSFPLFFTAFLTYRCSCLASVNSIQASHVGAFAHSHEAQLLLVFGTNLLDTFCSLVVVFATIIVLASDHSLNLAKRFFYLPYQRDLIKKPQLFGIIGVALLWYGLPALPGRDLLTHLIKLLA